MRLRNMHPAAECMLSTAGGQRCASAIPKWQGSCTKRLLQYCNHRPLVVCGCYPTAVCNGDLYLSLNCLSRVGSDTQLSGRGHHEATFSDHCLRHLART